MFRVIIIACIASFLFACAKVEQTPTPPSPKEMSELQQGKRLFEDGYYKRSLHYLLPLACDGNAEAQYAVGYMYYYGYGVAQDTEVGYFWIRRSANQGFQPAVKALFLISQEPNKTKHKLQF